MEWYEVHHAPVIYLCVLECCTFDTGNIALAGYKRWGSCLLNYPKIRGQFMTILPGFVRVSNLRRDRGKYRFDLSLDITLRDVYYRRASGEFGFPPQLTPVSAATAQVFSETLRALAPILAAEALGEVL
jgi:hypothetical protein